MLGKAIGLGAVCTAMVASVVVLTDRVEGPAEAAAADVADAGGTRFTRLRLRTGVELQVAQSGPADGEPVLFLHGYADSWYSYSSVLDVLPSNIRAIVPTQRGHGDSEDPRCCYRLHDFAEDAVALLEALGVERATVVGHSMGSFVAQRIAIDHPSRVSRLVLIGSGATIRTQPVLEFGEIVKTLPDTVEVGFVREFQKSTALEPLPAAFLDGIVSESVKLPGWLWRDVLASIATSDAVDDLHRIQSKTLIIWGEHDGLFVRDDQDGLLRAIPDARLVAWADASHSPQWEHPARFVTELRSFLAEPAAASAKRQ